MDKKQFKTNIKCGACVAAVTPHLNENVGDGTWEVDLQSSDRLLTITTDDEKKVIDALEKAGYKGELIKA